MCTKLRELADISGVSYGSIKRFEQTGQISLLSLTRIAMALDIAGELAEQCRCILNTEYSDKLDELFYLGGSSGGARPKILTEIDGMDWIIKFPAHVDSKDAGKMEYDYSVCAKACGILMSETKLFLSKHCKGYFGLTRFDRTDEDGKKKKRHMLTAAALLELDYTQPR